MTADPAAIAVALTAGERAALRSLPARDRGHMPDELWWAYYAILDAGLSTSAGDFLMVPTALGKQVLASLDRIDGRDGD
ncbi:hypothetical protein [Flavisphingomonas formosensis]|uniref:hypothetical protein n=1 Tax=Flavisphingomonas formosensis TaxID=861534 RepID=UPI0012FBF89F|nr:hypothetical protein [Sphingomonas formosensis]